MALPLYLAMTGAEFQQTEPLPEHVAWMACHFSAYTTGLSNFPTVLPEGSMLIVNDRTPPSGHDPCLIAAQLQQFAEQWHPCGILLDCQRPGDPLTAQIVKAVTDALSCPVGVAQAYAEDLSCPVFLDPVPLHISLAEHIAPWQGHPIWLDAALDCEQIGVYPDGSRISPLLPAEPAEDGFEESTLHCRYRIKQFDDHLLFTLWRTEHCLSALLQEAESLGIEKAFGLYQQLGSKKPAD